jgi:hypothetical protein
MITISNGQTVSSVSVLGNNTLIGFQFVNGWTGSSLTFNGSVDNQLFGPIYDSTGNLISITVPSYVANMIVSVPTTLLSAIGKIEYLQVVSDVAQTETIVIVPVIGIL